MTTNIFKNAWKLMSLLLLLPAVTLSSCSDDNDEPEAGSSSKYKEVIIEYSASVGNGYADFWDVEVTYTTPGGNTETQKLDTDFNTTYRLNPADEIPTTYVLNITAKPDADAPQPNDDEIYSLAHSYQFTAYGVTESSSKELIGGNIIATESTSSTDGAHIKAAMGTTRQLVDHTYTIQL